MENSGIPQNIQQELKDICRSLRAKNLSKIARIAAELSWHDWNIPMVVENLYREFDRVMHKGYATKERLAAIATVLTERLGLLNYKFPRREAVLPNVYFYGGELRLRGQHGESSQGGNEPNAKNELVLYGCGLSPLEEARLNIMVELEWAVVAEEWTDEVTHVVVSSSTEDRLCRTKEVLLAILRGKWIATSDWMTTSIDESKVVSEEEFEVDQDKYGSLEGPTKGRIRVDLHMPGLLAGSGFTLSRDLTPSVRQLVEKLVSAGGGQILGAAPVTSSHRRYFIFNDQDNSLSASHTTCKEFLHFTDNVPNSRLVSCTKLLNAIISYDSQSLDTRGYQM